MAKPNPLSALESAGKSSRRAAAPAPLPPASSPQLPAQPAAALPAKQAPSREGKVMVGGYFDATTHKQLKMLGVEQDKTVQDLLAESLDLLFARYGKPQIGGLR